VLATNPALDATLCFCAGDGRPCSFVGETDELIGSDDDAVWESGDVGGFECYIAADEGEEDGGPDVYDEEDGTTLLSVQASNNTLSLVYRTAMPARLGSSSMSALGSQLAVGRRTRV